MRDYLYFCGGGSSSQVNQTPEEIILDGSVEKVRFQKESGLLQYLPYHAELDLESSVNLEKILVGIAKSVLRKDFQNDLIIYTKALKKYVELYGRRFTKKQHVQLINLYMEILTIKTCPVNFVEKVAKLLIVLLKKPEFITKEDLVIPWRPLYETLDRWCYHCTHNVPSDLENILKETIRLSNFYFPTNTFEEVVAEFTIYLDPTSEKMDHGLTMLICFLPFHDLEVEIKINDLLNRLLTRYMDTWNNHPSWEWTMISLVSKATINMPGSFKWEQHLSKMYARCIKGLELPIHYKEGQHQKYLDDLEFDIIAGWMVSTLGNDSMAMDCLSKFLKSLETFYNPANQGIWTTPLANLLDVLVENFFLRIKTERYGYKKSSWTYRVANQKLTDEDIDAFVEIISHLIVDLYFDLPGYDSPLRRLAIIRPKKIVSAVMEKFLLTVETLIEPEKYVISLQWMSSVLFPMIKSRNETDGYDGRNLVMPFAQSLLPAINPNDMSITAYAFNCLWKIFHLVPFVDCSSLAHTLSDAEEKELCLATACMQDFVMQFLDKIFALVDNFKHENTRMFDNRATGNDAMLDEMLIEEKFFWEIFHRLASQTSTEICEAAVKKVVSYALGSSLETDVSGRFLASILQAFAVARPDSVLPRILSFLCSSVKSLIDDNNLDDESLDQTLMFHMLLLSYILETNGAELLKYRNEVDSMLESVFQLNGKKAYELAAEIFRTLLQSLTQVYPTECRSSDANYDDPNYIAIKDWGETMQANEIKMAWHTPSQIELDWAKDLYFKVFRQFSSPFDNIASINESNPELNKKILKNLAILQAANDGMSTVVTFCDYHEFKTKETVTDFWPCYFKFGLPKIGVKLKNTIENAIKTYFDVLSNVHRYLEQFKADDVDAFLAVLNGYDSLVNPVVQSCRRLLMPYERYPASVKEDWSMDGTKKWRSTIIDRAYRLHIKRVKSAVSSRLTKGHVKLFEKIFVLCINRYAKVRINAQALICNLVKRWGCVISSNLTKLCLPKLQEGIPSHEYKGVLFTLYLGYDQLYCNSWREIRKLWSGLVRSPFSEKSSVIAVKDLILDLISYCYIHRPLDETVSIHSKIGKFSTTLLSEEQRASILNVANLDTSDNHVHFNKLVEELLTEDSNNHWRQQLMCIKMLSVLITQDTPISEKLVTYFYESAISQSDEIRSVALSGLQKLLELFKRQYKSIEITEKNIQFAPGESFHSILQYKPVEDVNMPVTHVLLNIAEKNCVTPAFYVHKTHFGFAAMPNKINLKLSPKDNEWDLKNQNEAQSAVLAVTNKFFNNKQYVQAILDIHTLDEINLGDLFSFGMIIQLIARNNGVEGIRLLVELAIPLGKNKSQFKQECCAVVLCRVLSGMKYWDNATIAIFWENLQPHFNECLNNVTQETLTHWNLCIDHVTENRDPNKMRFFIEFLSDRVKRSLEIVHNTSVDAYRDICFYLTVVKNMGWRGMNIQSATFDLCAKYYLDTPIPFRDVRYQISRLMSTVFECSMDSFIQLNREIPQCDKFVDNLFDALVHMKSDFLKSVANKTTIEANSKFMDSILKFKSVIDWVLTHCLDIKSSLNPALYRFIPRLCHFESYEADPELANICSHTLSCLARTLVQPKHIDVLFSSLTEAAKCTSWRARICVLEYLKVCAWNNHRVLSHKEEWANQLTKIVLDLLKDHQIEVREGASKILTVFLHCSLIPKPMDLLEAFKKSAVKSTKIHRQSSRNKNNISKKEQLKEIHSAILGMCSFIDAHPKDVPDFLPDVLIVLNTHLNDPQPIPTTLWKCFSNFRTNHRDNWAISKAKFSDDHLCSIDNILVPQCYYA